MIFLKIKISGVPIFFRIFLKNPALTKSVALSDALVKNPKIDKKRAKNQQKRGKKEPKKRKKRTKINQIPQPVDKKKEKI